MALEKSHVGKSVKRERRKQASSLSIGNRKEMQVMYDNVKHLGIPLKAWQAVFNNQFTLGELYQMHISNELWPKSL